MSQFDQVERLKFVAAADSFADNLKVVRDQYNVQGYTDGYEMIKSGTIDAILIATPHYFHPPYAIAGLKAGLHVLTEKPVSVTASAAQEVNEVAAANPSLKYAAMFQLRTIPKWMKAKQLIAEGRLGRITRVTWIITTWFRTQKYYDGGAWRATWEGEGGGVLTNQCPHNLDLLQWLAGMPSKVSAHVALGKYHDIEVEDEVVATLHYPNGAVGTFITTTAETPGTDYLEIVGDKGKLILEGGHKLKLLENAEPALDFLKTSPTAWGTPAVTTYNIETPEGGSHREIMKNFVAAILDNAPLVASGVEGINSVELANAMIYSGLKHQPVDLPMDRKAFDAMLAELIEKSKAGATR
jgi:predicted dehydrogenase